MECGSSSETFEIRSYFLVLVNLSITLKSFNIRTVLQIYKSKRKSKLLVRNSGHSFILTSLKLTELCMVQSVQIEAEAVRIITKIMHTVHYLESAVER